MSKLDAFLTNNANDERVIRILKLLDKPVPSPLAGRLIGQLMREEEL